MIKQSIRTIVEKNRITGNIINALIDRKNFLMCGHENPDEDCLASMVAFAILVTKFDKVAQIYINGHVPDNLRFLLKICKYNSIKLINDKSSLKNNIDTIVICDTPKPSMMHLGARMQKLFDKRDIIKIEIDHHIAGDGEYIGDPDYRLVTDASSASELIGFIALKLKMKKNILKKFMILDPFSRNFVLTVLTGIVGDTQMGQFLKSRRERKFYTIFSNMYNEILMRVTVKETNFTRMDEVFQEIQKLSSQEEKCYRYIIQKQEYSPSIGYVILTMKDMSLLHREYDEDTIISVTKAIANELAEKSNKVSLIAYYDDPKKSDLIQFRMRRGHNFKDYDLRRVLEIFAISNGGGHEGAIGFRVPKGSIKNLDKYVKELISRMEEEIGKL